MDTFGLPITASQDATLFIGSSVSTGNDFRTYVVPKNRKELFIYAVGGGGAGGTGVVGANSTAAGGGGGGSGGQTILQIPTAMLPNVIFVNPGGAVASGAGRATYVTTVPSTSFTADYIILCNGGGAGGNASGATAGTAGTAGGISTAANNPLFWHFVRLALAGQAGTAGGTTGAATNVTYPTTGLRVSGGGGGAGLGAAAAAGTLGGAVSAPGGTLAPSLPTLTAATTATTPPPNGNQGYEITAINKVWVGGGGGGSTHGSANTTGLVQSNGGNGAIGCGGGGSGGALTGSTAGTQGRGGPGAVLIVAL